MRSLAPFFALVLAAQAHDHYAAGIVDVINNNQPDVGEPLQIVGANGTGKIYHLCPRPVGQRCGGYYMMDEFPRTLHPADFFSFTALSDGQFDIEGEDHAHTGAWIWMEIVSVAGPPGGQFGFWDEDRSTFFTTPSVSFTANQPTGNYRFVISEGFDAAGEDPSGHIHGRSWTATKPGDYYVGMRLVDRSTNGPGGGPWHPPSQVYVYHFQAGPSFQTQAQLSPGVSATLTWPSLMGTHVGQTGITFQIERATSLAPANWQVIGGVTGTTAATATFTDPAAPAGTALYRLKYQWSTSGPIGAGLRLPQSAGAKSGVPTNPKRHRSKSHR
jgi:hypothetical protein